MKLKTTPSTLLTLILCFVFFFGNTSCKNEVLPKPSSFLRLEYPQVDYVPLQMGYPFSFKHASNIDVVSKGNYMIDLKYPQMNATLVLSYFPVKDNLKDLLKDAEKLTFKHMIKADDIQSTPYENVDSRVYGKLFEVYGDAATQIQFHATDSTDNFITGALYFYATPNYDSIYPAVVHLKKDVVHLMETLTWEQLEEPKF
ncbi:MAG: gliding motility lipoprotein GldD [Flavicella sp.]